MYSEINEAHVLDESVETTPTSLVSRRLHDFFHGQGLPRHKHSSQLAQILGLSRSGAFRKFQDGAFSASDLQSLAQHFEVDISALLSGEPARGAALADAQPARIFIGARALACRAVIGPELPPDAHSELVAVQSEGGWLVQPYEAAAKGPRHHVHELSITPAQRQLPRVAVLEDSSDLAANLKLAFETAGFRVELFSSAPELSRQAALTPFNAYVVDWWLNGKTSASALQAIREAQPSVPILLTTGAIANGNADEDDIVRAATSLRIQVVEKPFRLALLISQLRQLLGAATQ